MSRRGLIAGNWKMNGLTAALEEARALIEPVGAGVAPHADVLVCPPFTLLADAARACRGSKVAIGAQSCHAAPSGAHTGEISAEMIADAGATWVIAGHSERRAAGETDEDVRAKVAAGQRAGLAVILCVGETLAERDAGHAVERTCAQLAHGVKEASAASEVAVAYEPVWAIGTGRTPTTDDIAQMHAAIRARLADAVGPERAERTRILYGGSVNPKNAAEILVVNGVDGALVGGASLKARDFLEIIKSAPTS